MDRRIPRQTAELLEQQDGVLARWQAPRCGLSPAVIDELLRAGRWQAIYRGVYAAYTGRHTRASELWAAVRRCGPTAMLSHHSAAELDRLTDRTASQVYVTVAWPHKFTISHGEHDKRVPGIAVIRSRRATTARHPARLPPRTRIDETTLDLAQTAANLDAAVAWLSGACGRRLTTAAQLQAAMAVRPKMRWRAELSSALCDIGDGAHSVLEFRYVRDVERAHGLPAARRQPKMATGSRNRYLDNLYAEFGVTVELDGQAAHPPENRWLDLRRDNSLARCGLVILHYTWADVTSRPCRTAHEIAEVLQARGWTGRPSRCPSCPRSNS
jgi:very-short-patch-repair endonuclease